MNPEPCPGVGLGWVSSHPENLQNRIFSGGCWVAQAEVKNRKTFSTSAIECQTIIFILKNFTSTAKVILIYEISAIKNSVSLVGSVDSKPLTYNKQILIYFSFLFNFLKFRHF